MHYIQHTAITLSGDIYFKIRFNTQHGGSGLCWRVFMRPGHDDTAGEEVAYLVKNIKCDVPTYSQEAYDEQAGAVK